MCGRYTYYEPVDNLATRFKLKKVPKQIPFNYNVAPGQIMPVIVSGDMGPQLVMMKWGLIPIWAKDPKIGYKLINARDDTIFEKPMWRSSIKKKRCLIPADGFYEWKKPASSKENKIPYFIHLKDNELFAFAGVWETWKDVGGIEWNTYSIITTEPNKEMKDIHNRMPVILHRSDEATWLDPANDDPKEIETFLRPYEDNGLEMWQVSTEVNSIRNNNEKLIHVIG